MLFNISESLKESKKISNINFSLNQIGGMTKENQPDVATVAGEKMTWWREAELKNKECVQKFVENIESIIRTNTQLFHLNLEGMQLKNHILKLGDAIRESKSLHAVHLGSNQSSFHAQLYVCSKLGINLHNNRLQK